MLVSMIPVNIERFCFAVTGCTLDITHVKRLRIAVSLISLADLGESEDSYQRHYLHRLNILTESKSALFLSLVLSVAN
jgi:hypothetical protein